MSERYTRVFSLPENLYAVGSPVVISAGALLKDNQTGKVLAQLKLTNIQYKKIKAVKVKLFPLDTMGQSLGEAIDYQYLDLQLTRDGDFGSKTPIPFPDATARAFAVEVTAVVFSDNTAWNSDGTPWEPIPVSVPLHSKYNSLVIEQLRLEQNGTCQFVVQEHKDLWLCACGAVNHDGEARCHECGKQLSEIYPLDVEGLTERANLRLAEEARQAAEEKAAREAAAAATKKETAKILKIVIPVICIVVAFVILLNRVIIPNSTYSKAVSLMEAGKFEAAVTAFEAMDGYKDSAEQIVKCENAIAAAEQARIEAEMAAAYKVAEDLADKGEIAKAAIAFGELGGFRDAWERCIALWADIADWETVAGMDYQTLGLKIDGTVVAVGENTYGVCDVSGWKDIIDIDAGARHSVALMANGTVVAIGSNKDMLGKSEINQCDVSSWTNIVDICTGNYHTVGLKADGTVVAAGSNYDATGVHYFGQCQVDSWKDITAVSAGVCHTVGLKSDGTVVAVGSNEYGQCNVTSWSDIIAISAGYFHTLGLKKDGTVVATGWQEWNACDVSGWRDIVAIDAAYGHSVGLKSDGTVMTAGWNGRGQLDVDSWRNIVAVFAGSNHTFGLKSDGTVVAVGENKYGNCDVSKWKNIKLPN